MVKDKRLYLTGKQIRVFIKTSTYERLKKNAKDLNLYLEQVAGAILDYTDGLSVSPVVKQESSN